MGPPTQYIGSEGQVSRTLPNTNTTIRAIFPFLLGNMVLHSPCCNGLFCLVPSLLPSQCFSTLFISCILVSSVKGKKAREIEERGSHARIGCLLVLKPIFPIMLGGQDLICPEEIILDNSYDGCRLQCHQIYCIFMVRFGNPAALEYQMLQKFSCFPQSLWSKKILVLIALVSSSRSSSVQIFGVLVRLSLLLLFLLFFSVFLENDAEARAYLHNYQFMSCLRMN